MYCLSALSFAQVERSVRRSPYEAQCSPRTQRTVPELARITTEKEVAMDTFYLSRTEDGAKLCLVDPGPDMPAGATVR